MKKQDLYDSNYEPEASVSTSIKNSCDLETDEDPDTKRWWILTEDDDGCNPQHTTESQESQPEIIIKEFL